MSEILLQYANGADGDEDSDDCHTPSEPSIVQVPRLMAQPTEASDEGEDDEDDAPEDFLRGQTSPRQPSPRLPSIESPPARGSRRSSGASGSAGPVDLPSPQAPAAVAQAQAEQAELPQASRSLPLSLAAAADGVEDDELDEDADLRPPSMELRPFSIEVEPPESLPPMLNCSPRPADDAPGGKAPVGLAANVRPGSVELDVLLDGAEESAAAAQHVADRLEVSDDEEEESGCCTMPRAVRQVGELLFIGENSMWSRLVTIYCKVVIRFPKSLLVGYTLLTFTIFGVLYPLKPLELDTDFSSFVRTDGDAMRWQEALNDALPLKKGLLDSRRLGGRRARRLADEEMIWGPPSAEDMIPEAVDGALSPLPDGLSMSDLEELEIEPFDQTADGRSLQSSAVFYRKTLNLLYSPKSGNNALEERVLQDMRQFEAELKELPLWKSKCSAVPPDMLHLCNPGRTFGVYAWPSEERDDSASSRDVTISFDAEGTDLFPLEAMIAYMQTSTLDTSTKLQWYFPTAYKGPKLGQPLASVAPPIAIRSTFVVRFQVGTMAMPMSKVNGNIDKVKKDWVQIIEEEVYPALQKAKSKFSYANIFYSGDYILDYEVQLTLNHDLLWVIGSFVFILAYLWLHTRSVILALSSLFMVFVSVPLAYVIAPAAKTTIASFLSVFLVLGVGCDVVFIFVDEWRDFKEVAMTLDQRLKFTFSSAGYGCFAAALTTSVSFFCNMYSSLQAMREFGLFMGLCVFIAFCCVLMFLPPILVLIERRRFSCCSSLKLLNRSAETRDIDISRGESGHLGAIADGTLLDHELLREPSLPKKAESSSSSLLVRSISMKRNLGDLPKGRAFFINLNDWISGCPCVVFLACIGLSIMCIVGVITNVGLDQAVPAVFPPDHNQVLGAKLFSKFTEITDVSSQVPIDRIRSCTITVDEPVANFEACPFIASRTLCTSPCTWTPAGSCQACSLQWCDASSATPSLGASSNASLDTEHQAALRGRVPETDLRCFAGATRRLTNASASAECGIHKVDIRIASDRPSLTFSSLKSVLEGFATDVTGKETLAWQAFSFSPSDDSTARLMAFEDWDTGGLQMARTFDISLLAHNPGASGKLDCGTTVVCFTGTPTCGFASGVDLGARQLPEARLLAPADDAGAALAPVADRAAARMLQSYVMTGITQRVSESNMIEVTVVWGLQPIKYSPFVGKLPELWRYDDTFLMENPWAQRAVMSMCTGFSPELEVYSTLCWIIPFAQALTYTDQGFPSRNFNSDLAARWSDSLVYSTQLWISNQKKVIATRVSFKINKNRGMTSVSILEYMQLWNRYVKSINDAASVTASGAWHVCSNWVNAEAEEAIRSSTESTIAMTAGGAFIGVYFFTLDCILSLIVFLVVIGIILALAFFMVCVLSWKLGAIEIIAIIVFVGYSVTYAQHIAHHFSHIREDDPELLLFEQRSRMRRASGCRLRLRAQAPADVEAGSPPSEDLADLPKLRAKDLTDRQKRVAKTRMAMMSLGLATASSAISTLGSSVFLLCCTINIFVKLGIVVLSVTCLSFFFAILVLPAVLMLFGPLKRRKSQRISSRILAACRRGGALTLAAYRRRHGADAACEETPFVRDGLAIPCASGADPSAASADQHQRLEGVSPQ